MFSSHMLREEKKKKLELLQKPAHLKQSAASLWVNYRLVLPQHRDAASTIASGGLLNCISEDQTAKNHQLGVLGMTQPIYFELFL